MTQRHIHRDKEHKKQEMLEAVWTLREDGGSSAASIFDRAGVEDSESVMDELIAEGLARREGDEIFLTEEGEDVARNVIRRHRLAELLLHQVMELNDERAENEACEFEHVLNPDVTDSICTLLGHPRTCPHGKPIPRARCCEKFRTEVQPLVQRLADLAVGQAGWITVIAPKYHSRLDRLGSFGVVPGAEVRLHQKFPSFVIQIGETTVAVDRDIADEILVRLAPPTKG